MRRPIIAGLIIVAGLAAAAAWLRLSTPGNDLIRAVRFQAFVSGLDGVSRTRDIMIPMEDGVKLATDLYLPEGRSGPVPSVLLRLPYGKTSYWEARHWISLFAPAGYAVIVQDMRGRHGSEGVFAPWPHSADDGSATLDWIARQDWSDGQAAMIGCSALGETQIVLAAQGHPALKAILPIGAGGAIGSAGGLYQYFGTFRGGIPLLAAQFGWFALHGGKTPDRMNGPSDIDFASVLRSLPVHGMVSRVRPDPTDFDWFLEQFENDAAMADAGYIGDPDRFATPAFLIDEWHDPNVNATLELARMMDRDGVLDHVVIGPGRHCDFGRAFQEGQVGDIAVDPEKRLATDRLYLDYLNHVLRDGRAPELARYTVYIMQADEWLSTENWPPPRTGRMRLYLGGDGLAEAPSGGQRRFRADPLDPVPTIGGAICCTGNPDLRTGPLDQRPIEGRDDLLLYDSAPLEAATVLAGPVSARVHVSADVPDADLVLRLTDVAPDGRSITIREGALRLRYREGAGRPQLLTPGEIHAVDTALGDIAYLVRPGHRLRLHVTGSSFPRLARNLHGAEDPNRDTVSRTAKITIHSGSETLSYLSFFVLHGRDAP